MRNNNCEIIHLYSSFVNAQRFSVTLLATTKASTHEGVQKVIAVHKMPTMEGVCDS